MNAHFSLSRRGFLQASALAGGGFMLGFIPRAAVAQSAAPAGIRPPFSTFVKIFPDNSITLVVPSAELGQGVFTTLPLILAEAMDADWERISVEHAPFDPNLGGSVGGSQNTGGSYSVRSWLPRFLALGAAAKAMLIAAASRHWGVAASECEAHQGRIIHGPSGRTVSFGEVAAEAAKLPVPQAVEVKQPRDFKFLTRDIKRLDTPAKTDGSAVFGVDVEIPGMVYAAVKMPPVFGGTVKSVNPASVAGRLGVLLAAEVPGGVAVAAEHWWQAKQALDDLAVEFDSGPNANLDDAKIDDLLAKGLDRGSLAVAAERGDANGALVRAAKTLTAVYDAPYLAHACMEPMNATVHVTPDGAVAHIPTQSMNAEADYIAGVTGLPLERIKVFNTFCGGGFGRRGSDPHATRQAAHLSQRLGRPVKVIWDREQDIQWDQYRPIAKARMEGGLDDKGTLVAYRATIASQSIEQSLYDDPLAK
ncbi:MAG TPA: molybdopterin cofactor-binding domain-containing protein, partial [Sphingomonadales bacterium]|nr:molybdopterin cofactor-binding domain-containing protein [Sphingomonadales bacterium]